MFSALCYYVFIYCVKSRCIWLYHIITFTCEDYIDSLVQHCKCQVVWFYTTHSLHIKTVSVGFSLVYGSSDLLFVNTMFSPTLAEYTMCWDGMVTMKRHKMDIFVLNCRFVSYIFYIFDWFWNRGKPNYLIEVAIVKVTMAGTTRWWWWHDDVIKWKHFLRHWPLCGEFTGDRWIPHTKASDAELWCFLWSAPE